jgi:hypothetical protein
MAPVIMNKFFASKLDVAPIDALPVIYLGLP